MNLDDEHQHTVNWDTFGGAITSCAPARKKFVVKWISQHCALGVTMRKRKARHSNRCPRCNEFIEDSIHCIRCPDREARTIWNSSTDLLEIWMDERHTHPEIITAIMGGLHAWHRAPNLNFTGPLDLTLPITRAISSQNIIEWFSLLNGFLSKEWIAIQDRHYKSITSRRTGRRWAIDFIQELWSISFALRMHRNDRLHNSPKIDELLGQRT